MLYILWVDALITLLPRRVQRRVYAALGQPDEELADDAFEETPTMLPFGPFLAIGALLSDAVRRDARRVDTRLLRVGGLLGV
jgi:prepilin signal peptidase PulO-like enzyme (type II secretory pathway)